MYISHHEHQLGELLQHQMENRKTGEVDTGNTNSKERDEKFRLEVLKQKDKTCESAIASPEVKHSFICRCILNTEKCIPDDSPRQPGQPSC